MMWWGWVVVGAILLGAELALVDAQFYLVFVGIAAIITGLVTVASPGLAEWAQWALFGVLAIVSMVAFRGPIYRRLRGHAPEVKTGPAGGYLTLEVALAPGESTRLEHGGVFWTARNDGDEPIPAGGRARITHVHHLTLAIRLDA
jgi:membrane protein implicated in regulation of membrane protease activity